MAETAVAQNCSVEGCKRVYRAKGYCNIHYRKWRQGQMDKKGRYKICVKPGCRKPRFHSGLCEGHYNEKIGKPAAETPVEAAPVAEETTAPAEEAAPETVPEAAGEAQVAEQPAEEKSAEKAEDAGEKEPATKAEDDTPAAEQPAEEKS